MSRTRKLLGLTGLAAMMLTGAGANAAAGQEGSASSDGPRDVPVVHDRGLDSSPTTDSAPNLVACYDGEKPWDAGTSDADGESHRIPGWDDDPDSAIGETPVYVASSDCNDVNIRITSELAEPLLVRVCFFPTSQPDYCNQWSEIAVGDTDWHVIATRLIDGTRFNIEFANPGDSITGYVAY
jgi:hypothetical protein